MPKMPPFNAHSWVETDGSEAGACDVFVVVWDQSKHLYPDEAIEAAVERGEPDVLEIWDYHTLPRYVTEATAGRIAALVADDALDAVVLYHEELGYSYDE